jgi:hypothetical protein
MLQKRKKNTQATSVSWVWCWCHHPPSRGCPPSLFIVPSLSPEQPASRGSRHSQTGEQRTWCVGRHKRRGQGLAFTSWRAEDVVCQQVQNRGTKGRHSRTGEQRMWYVSRRKMEGPRTGTHQLESRGRGVAAGTKQRDRGQALTGWRAEDAVGQQAQNGGTEGRHPRTGE